MKLELNPLSYKEVPGGRFQPPIRTNTGFVAATEEESEPPLPSQSPHPPPASAHPFPNP